MRSPALEQHHEIRLDFEQAVGLRREIGSATTKGLTDQWMNVGWRGQRLRHLEPRLKPGGKYEMATVELRGNDTFAPAMARQLVAEAVALNAQLGDPTDADPPRARRKNTATRK